MDPVFAIINRWQVIPFQWGERDCITLVADYVRLRTGQDPAADLRLTYSTAGECQRVTRFFTDPLGVVAPRMEAAGLSLTETPRRGDVGVVLLDLGASVHPHGAICLGGGVWAVKTQESGVLAMAPLKVLAAWGVDVDA
jgi:hypothetical protein